MAKNSAIGAAEQEANALAAKAENGNEQDEAKGKYGRLMAMLNEAPAPKLFATGKAWLERELGIVLVPDPNADDTCFLQIYSKSQFGEIEPGIVPAISGFYAKFMTVSEYDELLNNWRPALCELIEELGSTSADDFFGYAVAEFWAPLLTKKPGQMASELESYVCKIINQQGELEERLGPLQGYADLISFSPASIKPNEPIPRAYVPEANWFDERFDGLTIEQIGTLFPGPELEMLMLILGRAICGRSQSLPIGYNNAKLEHKFRKMCIVFGKDPHTGKTTFMEHVLNAMASVGYAKATFRNLGERFNMGKVYTADIAFKDDTTADQLASMLKAGEMKTLITGGQLFAENKGTNGFTVAPKATLAMCTNDFDQNMLWNIDAGVIDRLSILYSRSLIELKTMPRPIGAEDSPDMGPYKNLPWLAKKHKTTVNGIMLWFLRQCADKFLALCQLADPEAEIAKLTSKMRFPLTTQAMASVVRAIQLAMLLRLPGQDIPPIGNKSTFVLAMRQFAYLQGDKRAHEVRGMVKANWETMGRPYSHPWVAIKLISTSSLDAMLDYMQQASSNKAILLDEFIKASFSKIATQDGISIGSGPTHIKRAWEECRTSAIADTLLQLANDIQQQLDADPLLHNLAKALKDRSCTANLEHSLKAFFDPQQSAEKLSQVRIQAEQSAEAIKLEAL